MVFAVDLPQETAGEAPTLLEKEEGGAVFPGFGNAIGQDEFMTSRDKAALLHQQPKGSARPSEVVLIQGLVDGVEATAEEEAAVIASAGEHGDPTRPSATLPKSYPAGELSGASGFREGERQIDPAGMMGESPEDGVEEAARVGGWTALMN